MAITKSGNAITQETGTNMLRDIGAVIPANRTLEVGSSNSQYTVYSLDGEKIEVKNILEIDQSEGVLLFKQNVPAGSIYVHSSGHLKVGKEIIQNGEVYYPKSKAIIFSNLSHQQVPAHPRQGSLGINNSGRFTLTGAEIEINAGIYFGANSTINIKEGKLTNNRGSLVRIRMHTEKMTIDGLTLVGGLSIDFFRRADVKGLVAINGDRTAEYVASSAGGTNHLYINEGYNSQNMNYDFSLWGGANVLFRNPFKHIHAVSGNSSETRNIFRETGTFEVKTISLSTGQDVSGVKFYYKDFNNSKRKGIKPGSQEDYKFLDDKIYNIISTAQGVIDGEILYRVGYSGTTTEAQTGFNYKNMEIDWRTQNSDAIVVADLVSYNHKKASITLDLKTGKKSINEVKLQTDTLITELNGSIANNYTTQETAQKVYDQYKYLYVENYSGEAFPLARQDNTLEVGNSDVEVVVGTGKVSFANNKLTIRVASSFNGNIKTTGTVTLLNNAKVTGSISDASGDSNLQVTVPTGYEHDIDLHLTKADAEAQTNLVATGESFSYQSSTMGGKTVWFRMTKKDGSYIIQSHVAPTGAGNYQISLVVTSENQALGEIRDNVRVMLTELNEARDHARAANQQTKQVD